MGCSESRPPPAASQVTIGGRPGGAGNANSLEAKVVLLGDSGVGKSSLALRFCQGRFIPHHEVTIGAAFLQQIMRLNDGSQLKLHIWDTGGQERFRAMAPLYYRDAAGAVIVYDCNDEKSYESVQYWAKELRAKGPPRVCIAVAANKSDMEEKAIKPELAEKFCVENDMAFVQTSAKTGDNVGKVFEVLANRIHQEMTRG
mmetsp:Transcript_41532/g.90483  ORF Transcript_41532/g.90483 Transcript_41532/m.90483 type:complete len:200 (+) Transcript_41532:49-648(+)